MIHRFVCFVFLLVILANCIDEERKRWSSKQIEKYYSSLYSNCELINCKDLKMYENENCIFECICKDCYAKVYGMDPLEPGEIDRNRESAFKECTTSYILTNQV